MQRTFTAPYSLGLAAAMEGPISAIVITVELTQHLDRLLAPLLVAVAGAMLAAQSVSSLSIYSARVKSGKAEADEDRPGCETISAAARYGAVLRALLQSQKRRVPLYVIDEDGEVEGEIRYLPDGKGEQAPLQLATAADLASPVEDTG